MPLSVLSKAWEKRHQTRLVKAGAGAAEGSSAVTRLILQQAFNVFFVKINLFSEEKLPMDHPMLAKAVSSPAFSRWIDLGH